MTFNYPDANVIFNSFPTLYGSNIVLREPTMADIPVLKEILKEKKIIEEYLAPMSFLSLEEVVDSFYSGPKINFKEKKQVLWIIEDIKTKELIGARVIFVDSEFEPVTVQGFVKKSFRRKGVSAEAYMLITNLIRKAGLPGLLANTSIDNIAAIKLLHSAGFRQKYILHNIEKGSSEYNKDYRCVFFYDTFPYKKDVFHNALIKHIVILSKMIFNVETMDIVEHGVFERGGEKFTSYLVEGEARNTIGDRFFVKKFKFISDGHVLMPFNRKSETVPLTGFFPFFMVYDFFWEYCVED